MGWAPRSKRKRFLRGLCRDPGSMHRPQSAVSSSGTPGYRRAPARPGRLSRPGPAPLRQHLRVPGGPVGHLGRPIRWPPVTPSVPYSCRSKTRKCCCCSKSRFSTNRNPAASGLRRACVASRHEGARSHQADRARRVGARQTKGSHRQFKHPNTPGKVTVAGKPSLDIPP